MKTTKKQCPSGRGLPEGHCFLVVFIQQIKKIVYPLVVRISTRVATSPFQSNSLRGQGEEQTTKKQCPSWSTGREVMTTSSWPTGREVMTTSNTPPPWLRHCLVPQSKRLPCHRGLQVTTPLSQLSLK